MSRIFTKLVLSACFLPIVLMGCKKDAAKCGNGIQEGDEVCDGSDFGGQNCQSFGFRSGTLTCSDACDLITYVRCNNGCGNGRCESYEDVQEECDGSDFCASNCQILGFDYGDLACNQDCTLNTEGCKNAVCGNGEIEEVEECEPGIEVAKTCEDFGFNEGEVFCYEAGTENECHYDIEQCVTWECGNGIIDPGENCDFDSEGNELLDEETCETQGYDFGDLHCVPADSDDIGRRCRFDVSECQDYECGNGVVEGDEQCEVGVEITVTCMDEGFGGGDLACRDDGTCLFDYSGCTDGCGNGIREGEEECDGDDLGGQDCNSISGGELTGPLRCKPDCTFDLTLCETP